MLQFTLKGMLIVTAVCAAVLGVGIWQGPPGVIKLLFAVNLCLFARATYVRRKRAFLRAAVFLVVPLLAWALWYFGPGTRSEYGCAICGKGRRRETFLGWTWRDEEYKTNVSEWYGLKGLRLPCAHRWVLLPTLIFRTGPRPGHGEMYTRELEPLLSLYVLSHNVDESTFHEFVKDYEAIDRDDPATMDEFVDKCDVILSKHRDPDGHIRWPLPERPFE